MREEVEQLVARIAKTWPRKWAADGEVHVALEHLIERAQSGQPTSLPIFQASTGRVAWLTIASSERPLREYIGDLAVWLEASDARATDRDLTGPAITGGPLSDVLQSLSPHGYLRWDVAAERVSAVLARLHRMHLFLESRPQVALQRTPSVAALRLEFISALRVGDWERAEQCINEVDRWNLAHAQTTLQMRIRLLDAKGAYGDLFRLAKRTQAWKITNPQRIAAAILKAIEFAALKETEESAGIAAAYMLYRTTWHPHLVHCVADARNAEGAAKIRAFAAAADGDLRQLAALGRELQADVFEFLSGQVAESSGGSVPVSLTESRGSEIVVERAEPPSAPSADPVSIAPQLAAGVHAGGVRGDAYWTSLCRAVVKGDAVRAKALLALLEPRLLSDTEFLVAAPDAVLEMLSDPGIEHDARARLVLYDVLAELIDAFVSAPGFPCLAHQEVYLSLLDGLVSIRGGTASEADSQLVLGLISALIGLSPLNASRCELVIRDWWDRRPIVSRLDWLAAALDTVAPLHCEAAELISLYSSGLALAARKGVKVSFRVERQWRLIGRALEVPAAVIDELLAPLLSESQVAETDRLAEAGLKRIAIVSLREASAQEAAEHLAQRTGAKVSIVTSLVADRETRQAVDADLVLYVWAASSHATYRAFDHCRERLEYVQGTGATSIVMAAERWAGRLG